MRPHWDPAVASQAHHILTHPSLSLCFPFLPSPSHLRLGQLRPVHRPVVDVVGEGGELDGQNHLRAREVEGPAEVVLCYVFFVLALVWRVGGNRVGLGWGVWCCAL